MHPDQTLCAAAALSGAEGARKIRSVVAHFIRVDRHVPEPVCVVVAQWDLRVHLKAT